jgi:signal transduction histidine kinase
MRRGRVALCNTRAVALLDAEGELRGAPARRAFERLAHVDDALWQMLEVQAGAVPLQQAEARNAEGKELLVTTTACEGGSAGMIGYIVNITDVSALKAASRAREEAMAFLSHDLRAPQAAILSVLELRRAEPPTVSEDQLLEQIERSVRRTLALAEAFVTLTRADHLDPTRFALLDLLDVCREMNDAAWPLAHSKDVRIGWDWSSSIRWPASMHVGSKFGPQWAKGRASC